MSGFEWDVGLALYVLVGAVERSEYARCHGTF